MYCTCSSSKKQNFRPSFILSLGQNVGCFNKNILLDLIVPFLKPSCNF